MRVEIPAEPHSKTDFGGKNGRNKNVEDPGSIPGPRNNLFGLFLRFCMYP